jgi:hypothetical protein
MDDVENHTSRVEVAETEAIAPAIHNKATDSEESHLKPFDFFGSLPAEVRDMIYAQPGMTATKVIGDDDFDGVLGDGNRVRVTITKPLLSLCLVNKKFSAE